MTTKRDYYEILGVSRSADAAEIKKAYRQAALKYHPDRNPGDKEAEERFKEASEAYEVLSDPQKKSLYDSYGHAGLEGSGFRGFSGVEDVFSSFGDIFEEFFGGSPFGDIFGTSRRSHAHGRRGADLGHEITITFEESAFGAEREISVTRQAGCETCGGSGVAKGSSREACRICGGSGRVAHSQGFFMIQTTCPKCRGEGSVITKPCGECRGFGRVRQSKKLNLKVPPGIEDATRLILRGEGDAGEGEGPPGDLYVMIHVRPHDFFKRDGDHIKCSVPVSFTQAALGAKINVPTLFGEEEVVISQGIETGEIIRLKGKGFTNVHTKKKGDQIVEVFVKTPKKLSRRQKELLEEFERS